MFSYCRLVHVPSVRAAIALVFSSLLFGCASDPQQQGGSYMLRWIEKPSSHGPSQLADPADQTHFVLVLSHDKQPDITHFEEVVASLREGDVIAYRMSKQEASKELLRGHLSKIGYQILKYGHLAIVIHDPQDTSKLKLFSSESFKGPNAREELASLKTHDFDVYRLDKWDRVNKARLDEFVQATVKKAGKWYGYDFMGMFGFWNSNLRPSKPEDISYDYICSTVVVTALYYSGVDLDVTARNGVADIVTPLQVVSSKGRIISPPDVEIGMEVEPGKKM